MRKKSSREQAGKLTFRLTEEYAELVHQLAEAAGLSPNQLGRMATMVMVQNRFHELPGKMGRLEDELIRLRKDFNDAVYQEGE